MYLCVINGLGTRPDLCVRKTSEEDLAQLQVDYNEGNSGIMEHLNFWESSNEKLTLGYKIQAAQTTMIYNALTSNLLEHCAITILGLIASNSEHPTYCNGTVENSNLYSSRLA